MRGRAATGLGHSFGLNFFVFDWYYNVAAFEDDNLNNALQLTKSLGDRHGMQFAIMYTDANPFTVPPDQWASAVNEWIGYMTDPGYVRINGKPLLVLYDMAPMHQAFGSSAAVASAFDQLREEAQAHGLPGVYIVGGLIAGYDPTTFNGSFADLSMAAADGYDAVSLYNWGVNGSGSQPFSILSDSGQWIWNQAVLNSPLPFIPEVTDGWDARPWNEGDIWFSRSPQDVTDFVGSGITWAETNPQLRVEPSPAPPVVLIEAWNELGEGSFLVPTVGDGRSYGDTLSSMLVTPPSRTRTVLTLGDSGPSGPPRIAQGTLVDEAARSVIGATISLTATAIDGEGYYAQYQLSEKPPSTATQAVVGFRVNIENGGPGVSDFSLYNMSYKQIADGIERVTNGDFSEGTQAWGLQGQAQLVTSDLGPGQMVQVQATSSEFAALTSAPFSVAPGEAFQFTLSARVAPASAGSGYFTVIFLNGDTEIVRDTISLKAGRSALGTVVTDGTGSYQLGIDSLGTSSVILESTFAGDPQRWPAYARVPR